MPLMFDSIIFDWNPYFGYNTTFVNFSLNPMRICYATRFVHFTVPQEGEVHCSSCANRSTHLVAHSSKRLNPLSVIILVCLGNT